MLFASEVFYELIIPIIAFVAIVPAMETLYIRYQQRKHVDKTCEQVKNVLSNCNPSCAKISKLLHLVEGKCKRLFFIDQSTDNTPSKEEIEKEFDDDVEHYMDTITSCRSK